MFLTAILALTLAQAQRRPHQPRAAGDGSDRPGPARRPADDQQLRRRSRHPHVEQRLAARRRAPSVAHAGQHPSDRRGHDGECDRRSMGPAGSVDYDITAPAWMPIKVEGQFNFITIDGAQAEVSADTVRGDIIIKGGTGFVTAKSIEGEILVEGARGKVNVSSVNQGIKILDTSGDITAESVNGPIAMTGIQSSSVEVSTTNGNITYEGTLSDGGRYTLTTHNGDLVMACRRTPTRPSTVRTYNGEFRTDLPLEGRIPPDEMHRGKRVTMTLGKGSADVTLESFGGTIRLRKGPAARPRGRE